MNPVFVPYVPPAHAGVKMSFGGGPMQEVYDGVLSEQADAQTMAKAVGATLINAATDGSLNLQFTGLSTGSTVQPWWLRFPDGRGGFAGLNAMLAYGPNDINGGGRGNPGAWIDTPAGWDYQPQALPAPVAPPAPAPAGGDPTSIEAAMYSMGNTLTSTAGGLTAAQDARLTHIENMMVAMLTANRIAVPTS